MLSAKARESPEDAVLASLNLLLSSSGGLPRTSLFGSRMTRDVLASAKADDVNLTGIKCDYTNKYVRYLNSNYL